MTTQNRPVAAGWVPPGPDEDPEAAAEVARLRAEREAQNAAEADGMRLGAALASFFDRMPPHVREAYKRGLEEKSFARTGDIATAELEAERQAAELRRQREEVYGPAFDACVPDTFRRVTLNDLHPQQRPDALRWWLGSQHKTLILTGDSRVGKSAAAWAVARAARDNGRFVLGYSVPELVIKIRPPNGDQKLFDRVSRCEDLVLDDFGAEKDTDWVGEQLYLLLDRRVTARGRRLIVTTNLTAEEIAVKYGAPVVNRMRERAWVLRIKGQPLGGDAGVDW